MKKLILALLVSGLLLSGCTTASESATQIKAAEVIKLLDKGETLVVYLGASTCSACLSFKPTVKEIIKNYKIKIYYVEINNDVSADLESLIAKYLVKAEWTPTTYIFKEGKLLDSQSGALSYTTLKKWFVKYGVITE